MAVKKVLRGLQTHYMGKLEQKQLVDRQKIAVNAIFSSQCSCCPLTYLFLCAVNYDNNLSNEELLVKENSVLVYYSNMQALAMELYKVLKEIFSNLIKIFFHQIKTQCKINKIGEPTQSQLQPWNMTPYQ